MGNVVVEAVLGGEADDAFEDVYEAIKQRQNILARRAASSLEEGDLVTITGVGSGGRYLNGLVGKVEKVKQVNVELSFDAENAAKARRFGRGIVLSMNNVEKVAAA